VAVKGGFALARTAWVRRLARPSCGWSFAGNEEGIVSARVLIDAAAGASGDAWNCLERS
jgi:hypothetical protein